MSSYVTTSGAAHYLGLRPQTLRAYRLRGDGPPYRRLGKPKTGRVAYAVSDLEAYMSERTFRSTSQETVAAAGVSRG